MKFLFEMLFKTFPPSPGLIYFFVAHLTSCQSSRIYFLDGLSDRVSIHKTFQSLPLPTISYAFRALSISKFLLESLSTTLEGMLHSIFYKLVPSSDLFQRTSQSYDRSTNQQSACILFSETDRKRAKKKNPDLYIPKKTEFEAENRKLEN